jgi:hypothetical protein
MVFRFSRPGGTDSLGGFGTAGCEQEAVVRIICELGGQETLNRGKSYGVGRR